MVRGVCWGLRGSPPPSVMCCLCCLCGKRSVLGIGGLGPKRGVGTCVSVCVDYSCRGVYVGMWACCKRPVHVYVYKHTDAYLLALHDGVGEEVDALLLHIELHQPVPLRLGVGDGLLVLLGCVCVHVYTVWTITS